MIATQEQFAELAERHRHEIHVHCYRMLGSFEEAEDLVQETLLRAWRRREDLQREEHLRVPSLVSFRDLPWLEPYPDSLLDQAAPPAEEPDAALIGRETIELTFLAVVQLLPLSNGRC